MPSNASIAPGGAVLWRHIAQTTVTANAAGVAVDFATDLYDGATVVDLSDLWVYSLVIDNRGGSSAVEYRLGANTTDGAVAQWATVPAGQVAEFAPYHTSRALTLRRAAGSDQDVVVTAPYEAS